MKNKILLSLLFVIAFIILISASDKVSAFEFEYGGKTYNTDGLELYKYNLAYYSPTYNGIYLFSCENPVYITGNINNSGYPCMASSKDVLLNMYFYKMPPTGTWKFNGSTTAVSFSVKDENILYLDHDVCDQRSGEVIFSKTVEELKLNLTVTPDTDTKIVPVRISTDFYSLNVFEDILVQYSTNQNDWTTCSWGLFNDGSGSANKYNFYLDVYKNGTYYFRLWNAADNTYIYKTVIISNIVYSPDDVNNYVDGVFDPTPFLSYEYINDNKINIITQKFFIDQIIDLQCFFAKDISKEDYNNKDKWTKVEARTMIDQLTQRDVYQFCFEVDNNSFNADGTYTVCFYNVFLDKYTYSEIVINFNEILKVDGSMIWKYVHFFKERFGFLIYPFDLTINTLKRIGSINYSEPKFNIPDIYEPTTNKKLISAVTFNFNDYLENNTFKNVHNVYLIIVDAAIIFALLNLAWKKISGVFK